MVSPRLAAVVSGGRVEGELVRVEGLLLRPWRAIALGVVEVFISVSLLALSAKTSLKAPGCPVPFTLQTYVLTALILTLGSRAWRPVLLYLAAGLSGLPVFALGGGPYYIFSPTFGYLIGFLIASIFVGRYWSRPASTLRLVAAGLIALPLVYLPGWAWLTLWYHVLEGVQLTYAAIRALLWGVLIFIPWDLLKAVMAATTAKLALSFIYKA